MTLTQMIARLLLGEGGEEPNQKMSTEIKRVPVRLTDSQEQLAQLTAQLSLSSLELEAAANRCSQRVTEKVKSARGISN